MKLITGAIAALSRGLYWISCLAIVGIISLTVLDVILRRVGHPIDFAFEMVILLAAIAVGFALPETSREKGHVIMEFLPSKVSPKWRRILFVVTRLIGAATFIIIGWNIAQLAGRLHAAGQASPILKIPEFPVTYAVAVSCFVESLVLLCDLVPATEEEKE